MRVVCEVHVFVLSPACASCARVLHVAYCFLQWFFVLCVFPLELDVLCKRFCKFCVSCICVCCLLRMRPVCEFCGLCIYVRFVCIFFWVVFARVAVYTCFPGHCVLFSMIRFVFVVWCYVIVVCGVFDFCTRVY